MVEQWKTLVQDGLLASIISVLVGGTATWAIPNASGAAVAAGAGALGVVVTTHQQTERLRRQLQQELYDAILSDNEELPEEDLSELPSEENKSSEFQESEGFEKPPNDAQVVIDWLSEQGIFVETYKQEQPGLDDIYNEVAVYLGKHYERLEAFYKKIKQHANGDQFRFNLRKDDQGQISICTNFGKKLERASLLSSYRYLRTDRAIVASLQKRGDISQFFTGEWFERYILNEIIQILDSRKIAYNYLLNPKVRFSNENRFELDILFLIDRKPLWIECKTGRDHNAYLNRYSQHAKTLNIPKDRSFLIILDMPDKQAMTRTSVWENLTVANQHIFKDLITNSLV